MEHEEDLKPFKFRITFTAVIGLLSLLGLYILVKIGYAIHDCQSITATSLNGTWNKSFINCGSEPILNITNITNITQTTELKVFNYTFNDTLLSKSIENQTTHITQYFGDISRVNDTLNRVLIENQLLTESNRKFLTHNPSYETLSLMFNNTNSALNTTQNELQKEKDNKLIWAGAGFVAGIVGLQFVQQKQKEPEEKLFSTGGRAKGEEEPVKTDEIDIDIQKRITELKGGK